MKGRVVIIRICSIHADCINDMFCFAILQKETLFRFVPAGISLARLNKLLNLNNTHFILKL